MSTYLDFYSSGEFASFSIKDKVEYQVSFYNINGDRDYQTNYKLAQEYFEEVKSLYAQAGYPDEWKMHHQGGTTGYGCREFVVTPYKEGIIKEGQA